MNLLISATNKAKKYYRIYVISYSHIYKNTYYNNMIIYNYVIIVSKV